MGTVLIVPSRLTCGISFHSGVYLGTDTLIHLAPFLSLGEGCTRQGGQYFRFTKIDAFMDPYGEVAIAMLPGLQLLSDTEIY